MLRFVVCTLLAFALLGAPVRAAVRASFSFTVARAPHPLPLDAGLSDPAWAAGKVPDGTGPWENATTRSPATLATTAYMLYDDTNLYVGFKAAQESVQTASKAYVMTVVGFVRKVI